MEIIQDHCFLNRNGHNINEDDLNLAQVEALNMTPDFAKHTIDAMVAKLGNPETKCASFSLAQTLLLMTSRNTMAR